MVERYHIFRAVIGVVDGSVWAQRIPPLPGRSSATADRIEPGRAGILEQQIVGFLCFAFIGKCSKKFCGSDKAGSQMIVAGFDVIQKIL